ncbi:tetratricopeptide repeat protein, partial [Streptomyces clavuligerus]
GGGGGGAGSGSGSAGSFDRAAGGGIIALQAVSGMPGVGKTLLACHAARRLEPFFPDGQIHLHLRAHVPGQPPLTAEEALTALLRVLGVPPADIPDDRDALVGLWRTLLSSRRAVIVLDDVASAEQLDPLLPGPSPSLVIVTSRRRITGIPGIRSIRLGVLPQQDAIALFRSVAGEDRTPHTGEVLELVRLAGCLPLALEIAAGRLASRPTWTTTYFLHKLTNSESKLKEFRDGDRAVALTFDVSYRDLSTQEKEFFRFLGLRFGIDVDVHVAAALAGLPVDRAERVLETLLDAHLLQEPTPERFALHDLLAEFSRDLVAAEDPPAARERAVHRLVVFYVRATHAADLLINPRRLRPVLSRPASAVAPPPWDGPHAARRWIAAERTGLIAAERHCRATGHDREAALLADSLAGFLTEEGATVEAQQMHLAAAHHWQRSGDRRAETHSLMELATALSSRGEYEEALTAYERAIQGGRELGDTALSTEAVHLMALVLWHLGRLREALERQLGTLALVLRTGDTLQIARCRNNLGITHLYLGDFGESQEYFEAALTGFQTVGDAQKAASALNNLADLHTRAGNMLAARAILYRVVDIFTELGSRSDVTIARTNIADTMESPAELNSMMELYRESLRTFRLLGDRRNASKTLHGMGRALHAAGRHRAAADHHRRALDVARGIRAAHEEMQALHGLGLAEEELGDLGSAVGHIAAAVEVAVRTGVGHEADRARASLARLTGRMSEGYSSGEFCATGE